MDIVVGNSLSVFFKDIEEKYKIESYNKLQIESGQYENDPDKESNIYFFQGNFRKTPVQGGQIILERDSAKSCLLWWRSM